MNVGINVTIDSNDAHAIADWWAETLGWTVEPTDQALVDRALESGLASAADLTSHNGIRVWASGAAICPPDEAGRPGRRRILFNNVPEPKTVKNRMHFDLHFPDEDAAAVRSRLEGRGAVFLYECTQGPFSWYTMQDPQGNEFCISR
jgi:hypothetical protein